MTATQFVLGALRLAVIVVPLLIAAHRLSAQFVRIGAGEGRSLAILTEAVVAISLLVVGAELLGLVSLMRPLAMGVLFAVVAVLAHVVPGTPATGPRIGAPARVARGAARWATFAAVAIVGAQWLLATANSLGSGMLNFDTLWYHMPFAARFAQTASVTGIHFTQADPITAYYPANSELVHAIGITALHDDFLSPLLNLMWLAVALLASWCVGLRWRVQYETLTAGCLVLGLPVLSATQPGQAFNDVAALAMLLAALALIVNADGPGRLLVPAGLALGFAAGTKYTFLIPALALLVSVPGLAPRGVRGRTLWRLAAPAALTGGWWYLRSLIDVGNPLGLRLHLGPLTLPGPHSPIAAALQQTVLSELEHVSLWTSRFAPGLAHALGPLWPLLLVTCVAVVGAGIGLAGERQIRALALTAAVSGVAYLVLPTGATEIQQGTSLFEVNLRYATPALVIALLLVPIVVTLRVPRWLAMLGPMFLLLLVASQLERQLWPKQTGRHAAFLIAVGLVMLAGARLRRSRPSPRTLAASALVVVAGTGLAAYAVQRHYFARRYLVGGSPVPGDAALYRWARPLRGARIALYGLLTQYPLYGARDSNRVDYIGRHTSDGGFQPIASCGLWRATIARGGYEYVVLSHGPTGTVPVSWTRDDPAASVVLHPAPDVWVFRLRGALTASRCRT